MGFEMRQREWAKLNDIIAALPLVTLCLAGTN